MFFSVQVKIIKFVDGEVIVVLYVRHGIIGIILTHTSTHNRYLLTYS